MATRRAGAKRRLASARQQAPSWRSPRGGGGACVLRTLTQTENTRRVVRLENLTQYGYRGTTVCQAPCHCGSPGPCHTTTNTRCTRLSLSNSLSCPAGARGHPTPSIEVRLDLSLKVAKRTRPARLGSWWAAAGVGGHTDCAAAIAGLDVPPLSSIEEQRRRSISSSSERSAEASRSRCTPCWTCTLEAMAT